MSKLIPLSNSKKLAIVDDQFETKCLNKTWSIDSNGYVGQSKASRRVLLPQFLFGNAPKGYEWDHKNRNKLDNQGHNMRIATHPQNCQNRDRRTDNTSGFIGVRFHPRGLWVATIGVNRGRIHIGYFKSLIEAAKARDEAAFYHHGKFARLNFPIKRFSRLPRK
jgi:hypothetical protein